MKRFLSVILILSALVTVTHTVRGATSQELRQQQNTLQKERRALEQQQNRLRNEAEANQNRAANADAAAADAHAERGVLSGQISDTSSELVEVIAGVEMITQEITETEQEIERTKVKYDTALEQEQTLYAEMKERIRFMYELGEVKYVHVLLESASFADMVNKAEYIEQLYAYDRERLNTYVIAQQQAMTYKKELEEKESELETSKMELQEEQSYLETLLARYRSQYADADARLAQARADAATYRTRMEQQTAQANALTGDIAAKKAAEENARRAAEQAEAAEEAERQRQAALAAEEAARNAQQNAARNASSQSQGTTARSNTSSTNDPAYAGEDLGSSPNYSGSSSGSNRTYKAPGSTSGRNIADYALQFVGNPYVYGGTSLTNGADCSGFVQSVYKQFGISLPRTASLQRASGRGVSLSEAQPGDLVGYPGHIAIYIGNNCVVHASSPRTGIKVSPVTYRTILCVRRVL